MKTVVRPALAVLALVFAQPALAQSTFASFDLNGSGQATRNTNVTTGGGKTAINGYSTRAGTATTIDYTSAYATNGTPLSQVGQVNFNFVPVGLTPVLGGPLVANLFYLGVSAAGALPAYSSNTSSLSGFTGTIVFKPVASGTFSNGRTYDPNSVLLGLTFKDGTLTRNRAGPGGLSDGTGTPGDSDYSATEVSYYSDYLTFSSLPANRDFSTTFTNPAGSRTDFTASFLGSFASEAFPTLSSAVPEASTWTMMILGFGFVGMTLRRTGRREPMPA